jgi:hypothetical protein
MLFILIMSSKKISWSDVEKVVDMDSSYYKSVIDDVLKIVNEGKRYPYKNNGVGLKIPEDISASIAKRYFKTNPYSKS